MAGPEAAVHRTSRGAPAGDRIPGMTDAREVSAPPLRKRAQWCSSSGSGRPGRAWPGCARCTRAVSWTYGWPWALLLALLGIVCLYAATARVSADAHGLHSRTLLRRRHMPWSEHRRPAYVRPVRAEPAGPPRQCAAARRAHRRLPLPLSASSDDRPASTRSWTRSARCTAATAPRSRARPRHLEPHRRARLRPCPGAPVRAAARGRGPGRVARAGRRGGEGGVDVGRPVHHRDSRPRSARSA